MAQIIKHRRGSLEKLSEVTGSLQKGEIVIATGSANLTTTNGSALAFIVPESGSVQASNRFLMGSSDPAVFSASTYNGMVKGVPYYASGSKTLFLLGSDGNEAINLVGNIQPFSSSVDTRLGDLEASIGGAGSGVGARVGQLETISASYLAFTQSYYTDSASFDTRISASVATATENSSSTATSLSASIASVSALSASIATTDSASAAYAASQLSSVSSSVATSLSASAASVTSLSASIATTISTEVSALDGRVDKLEASQSAFDTAIALSGSDVTINGNFTVTGTQTIVNSTVVEIGDNIIELNGSGAANGGIYVKDATAPNTETGSIIWDSTNDQWKAGVKDSESKILLASGDNVFTSSIQTALSGTFGYDTFDTAISTSFSASAATVTALSTSVDSRLDTIESSIGGGGSLGTRVSNLETISGSYLEFTQSYYTDSSSFDTRISASVATATANSASAATSFSASLFTITDNSASVASDLDSLSGSVYTQFSASSATVTANSASAATSFSASKAEYTSFSASAASDLDTLSGSTYTQFSASEATATANSSSAATSFSASLFTITANSASIASDLGTLSGSVYTQFSESVASVSALSTSVDSRLDTIESSIGGGGSLGSRVTNLETISASYLEFTQSYYTDSASVATSFSASAASVTANSASAATSFSASLASQTVLSASVATTIGNITTDQSTQDGRLDNLEGFQSDVETAIEFTGSSVTIQGDLLVRGTTTSVNSTTIELGDNIIELNGSGAANGGLYVKDVTAPNTETGSIVWDSTNDYWKAGVKDSESKVLLASGDNVFSSSIQTALSGTFGYSTFDTAISTSFSASAANVASLSASVASVTGDFSSSVATSFSASAFTVTSNSASVATSFSASLASQTELSSSLDSRVTTLEGSGSIQGVGTSDNVSFSSVTASLNVPGGSSTKRLAFRGLTDNIEFVAAPTQSGDIAQWNGTDFVMSNVIDGGSF